MERIEVKKTSSKGIVMGKAFLVKEQDLTPEQGKIGSELGGGHWGSGATGV